MHAPLAARELGERVLLLAVMDVASSPAEGQLSFTYNQTESTVF